MYLVRDILHCKPGKVGEMVKRFKRVVPVMQRLKLKPFRISTDAGGERFWTVVLEFEVESIGDFAAIESKIMSDEEMGQIMTGYHDLVIGGRREYFKIEA